MRKRWLIAFATAGLSFGQPQVQITEVDRIAAPADDPVPGIVRRLSKLLLGPLSDNAAKAMLEASSEGSKSVLRWHLGEPTGAVTLTDGDFDILAAHWANTGNDAVSVDVWLWDDPIGCYFLLPFQPEVIEDRAQLQSLFESLWVWWEPDPEIEQRPQRIRVTDARTKVFNLSIAPTAREGLFGTGIADGDPGFSTNRPGRGRPSVGLYRQNNSVWIAIRLGRPWIASPRDMYEIPERFPPLRDRVADWSMNRLLYEYGRPLIADPLAGSRERDEIILTELLKRELAVAQLQQLLDRSPNKGRSRTGEGGMIIDLVVKAGKSNSSSPFSEKKLSAQLGALPKTWGTCWPAFGQ